jgi:hypothetical protein
LFLYLHRITDNRMGGTAMRSLRTLQTLSSACKSMSQIIFVTTMWSLIDRKVGQRRETQLRESENFWKPLISRGAQYYRFEKPSADSAEQILRSILGNLPQNLFFNIKQLPERKESTGQESTEAPNQQKNLLVTIRRVFHVMG